jgi:hypothetical protein
MPDYSWLSPKQIVRNPGTGAGSATESDVNGIHSTTEKWTLAFSEYAEAHQCRCPTSADFYAILRDLF